MFQITNKTTVQVLALLFTLFLSINSWGQFNGLTIQEPNLQSFRPRQIFELPQNQLLISTVANFSNAWFQLFIVDSAGNIIAQFSDPDYAIEHIDVVNSKIIAFGRDMLNYPNSSYRVIIFDSTLVVTSNLVPIAVNWPRTYFYSSTRVPQIINESPAVFGLFTDSSLVETNYIYGWLQLNESADSLIATPMKFESDSIRILTLFTAPENYYGHGFLERIELPWSATISVSVIRQFDDSMQLVNSTNLYAPSDIVGYPRFLESAELENLLVNEHSVYGFSDYQAASAISFSDLAYSFSIYQFDRDLNIKKIRHQLANPGRIAEVRNFTAKNISFDSSGKYIYAVGSHAEPRPLNFNDQDRTCAYTIFKYDTALNLIWRHEIEIPKTYLKAETLQATADGGVLVAGMRIDSTPNPNITNIFVVKLDSAGRHSVSVPDLAKSAQVKAYPNPVDDLWLVQWDQGSFERLELYNTQGQLCGNCKTEPHSNLLSLQLGHLPSGLYYYRLLGKAASHTGKVIKK